MTGGFEKAFQLCFPSHLTHRQLPLLFFKRKGKRQSRVNKLQEKNEAISEINRHRLADVIYMSLTCLPISTIKIVLPNVYSMTKIIYDQVTHRFGNKMCFIFFSVTSHTYSSHYSYFVQKKKFLLILQLI